MSAGSEHDITRLLQAAGAGAQDAVNRVLPLVYEELRRLAEGCLGLERPDHSLGATALVHEAYLRLIRQNSVGFHNRSELLAATAIIMRRILVDHARAKRREKRGGDAVIVALDEALAVFEERSGDLTALDEALTDLGRLNERKARLVELHFFGGATLNEAAEGLGVSPRTAARDWEFARAWLRDRLEPKEEGS